MIGIVTGDITKSRRIPSSTWVTAFKDVLASIGNNPSKWELYRGDEFQLEVRPEDALLTVIRIKAFLKTLKLDARMSIGIGDKSYSAEKITESNGTAFIRSGELFEKLRNEKLTLAINTGSADFDYELNLMLRLSTSIMNNWLPQSGEFVRTAIEHRNLSQEEIGALLGINQAAVSRRQKRSQFELIMEVESYFRNKIKTVTE
ncbi:MAG TPA: SatD family protein [Flavobacterium sp.]|jgi:hypothetical protein